MKTYAAVLKSPILHVFVIIFCLLCPVSAYAIGIGTGVGGLGTGRPGADDEGSRFPIKVRLEGFLRYMPVVSQRPEIDVVTLGIARYGEQYQFVLVAIEAVDLPRLTPRRLLKIVKKWQLNFDIVGPEDLLSEVAQALPGTPLTIEGFLIPRKRRFQLWSVEGFGFDMPDSETQAELLLEQEAASSPVEGGTKSNRNDHIDLPPLN